jgi:hypothetical protein
MRIHPAPGHRLLSTLNSGSSALTVPAVHCHNTPAAACGAVSRVACPATLLALQCTACIALYIAPTMMTAGQVAGSTPQAVTPGVLRGVLST